MANLQLNTPWTDERCDELRRLWAEGLTASAIARELGDVTRSGVLGKVMRLRLAQRKSAEFKPGPAEDKPRAVVRARMLRRAVLVAPMKKEPPMQSPSVVGELVPPKPRKLTLLQLADHHCRWPVEDHPEYRFCGAYRRDGEPYCRFHTRISRSRK